MTLQLSTFFADNLLKHGGAAAADAFGGGTLVLYSGTPPAGPNEALSGNTALATVTFSAATAQGTPAGGLMDLVFAATTVTASATGTATFFRMIDSAANVLTQGTVGTSGSDWNLTSTSIASGDNVEITGTPSISLPVA